MAEVLRVARQEFVRRGYRATTMDDIAAAAHVTKRTLYLWHADKAALFQACVMEGVARFPSPALNPALPVEAALSAYARALVREMSAEFTFGMGALMLREGREFPELAAALVQGQALLAAPLAAYLRARGLEAADSDERTRLLLAMIMSEVHAALLSCLQQPDLAQAERTAQMAVKVFLGSR